MALIAGVSSITAGVTYALGFDDIFVLAGANVISTAGNAIETNDSFNEVIVAGHVAAAFVGIRLGDSAALDVFHQVVIYAGASVYGGDVGISIVASNAAISNQGTLSSGNVGIFVTANGGPDRLTEIINTGTINGRSDGIILNSFEKTVIDNSGTIIAGRYALLSTETGIEVLTNTGTMYGSVRLGGGNDIYNGLGGRVTGTVLGDSGNDILSAGAFEDRFDGGDGVDTLEFRFGGAVRVALDGSIDFTGVATGDAYVGFENIFGSLNGADLLIGDSLANRLVGRGGNDSLVGRAGADKLEGGRGADTLSGGTGNDQFVFRNLTEIADIITDFSSAVAGNNDAFVLVAAGFGTGLVAGALPAGQFISAASNAAGDADDRFIFRNTDKTLWFDADGTGAIGPVSLADLQASATMTALDILLV